MRPTPETLRIPAKLIDELGGQDAISGGQKLFKRGSLISRKDRRKIVRTEKKTHRSGPPQSKRIKTRHFQGQNAGFRASELDSPRPNTQMRKNSNVASTPQPKSILKNVKQRNRSNSASGGPRAPSPPPARLSQSVLNKLAEDDLEIAALEKKLGIKGKKGLPYAFKDDGLDDLLQVLDGDNDHSLGRNKKNREEDDDWLLKKRKVAVAQHNTDEEGTIEEGMTDTNRQQFVHGSFNSSGEEESANDLGDDQDSLGTDEEFQGFDSDAIPEPQTEKKVRENPYTAPLVSGSSVLAKYKPPSLRITTSDDSEKQVRLRRQAQGLINRLTEANLLSILSDTEKMFQENARKDVTSILIDLVMTSVCEPTILPDTLIILYTGFITAVYKVVGTDFGAHLVQRVVELFDVHYVRANNSEYDQSLSRLYNHTKETSNLITLLAELYNFQVVGSYLLFDYIRLLLEVFSDLNAELLLKIIRTSGHQLRQDDPSSLKDIVNMIQTTLTAIGESKISVRTKFIIETINDLKNNRMKAGASTSAITLEHTTRMKKTLGTLNSRTMKGREPLRIGLKDIQESNKRGKWWLVGARWAGNENEIDNGIPFSNPPDHDGISDSADRDLGSEELDLAQLARDQRMNTDIRRAIFVTIMSASDYQDAYSRLTKLKLRKAQGLEIPKVLIHCAKAENGYNPYYTLIAKKLCTEKKLRMAFQFCLWDLFKTMGERYNGEEDEPEGEEGESTLGQRAIVNLAKMFGSLIAEGVLSLMVLKNLSWAYLQPQTQSFLEVLFISVFLQSQRHSETEMDRQSLINVLSKVKDSPSLVKEVRYFLKKVVIKTDITGGKAEKSKVKWCCKVALDVLEAIEVADIVD